MKKQVGKGYLHQLWDIVQLPNRSPSCNVWDYYDFRLYNKEYVPSDALVDYAGSRVQEDISQALNPRSSVSPGWDKLQCISLLRGEAFSFSRLKAVYRPSGGIPSFVPCALASVNETIEFLRIRSNYPMFTKPSYGQGGVGAFLLSDYDPHLDQVVLADGTKQSVERFVDGLFFQNKSDHYQLESGYLFQAVVAQHHAINEFQGSAGVSGFRLVVLNRPEGPKVLCATWKLTTGNNISGNFGQGTNDNLVAQVNLDTGRSDFAVNGLWPSAEKLVEHPLTRQSFTAFVVPFWLGVLESTMQATRFFPLMRIQHWDVAVTNSGPQFLELNDLGGTQVNQICGRGLLSQELRETILRYGNLSERETLRKVCLVGRASRQ